VSPSIVIIRTNIARPISFSLLASVFLGVARLSEGTRKRLSRIRRRACEEVQQAFSRGLISGHKADDLLYLPLEEQRVAIGGILAEREAAEHRSRIAAEVIRGTSPQAAGICWRCSAI
jgi:hypothetical protein